MRQIICSVVRWVEIDDAHIEIIFRVLPLDGPARPKSPSKMTSSTQHCTAHIRMAGRCRRRAKDWEKSIASAEARIYVAPHSPAHAQARKSSISKHSRYESIALLKQIINMAYILFRCNLIIKYTQTKLHCLKFCICQYMLVSRISRGLFRSRLATTDLELRKTARQASRGDRPAKQLATITITEMRLWTIYGEKAIICTQLLATIWRRI